MASYGTSIQYDPAAMASVAKIIDNQRIIIQNGLSAIISDASNLQNIWVGDSATAYQEQIKQFGKVGDTETAVGYIVGALTDYVNQLNAIYAEFESTRHTAATENQGLPGDVFGV